MYRYIRLTPDHMNGRYKVLGMRVLGIGGYELQIKRLGAHEEIASSWELRSDSVQLFRKLNLEKRW